MSMTRMSTLDIQKILKNMLKDLTTFAWKHEMKVILLGGSLLGQTRSAGFIPWDDDLDIGLYRKDYERLAKCYQPNNKRFKLLTELDPENAVPYMRIIDTQSVAVSSFYKQNHGVFLDIFPIDNFKKSKLEIKIFYGIQKILNIERNVIRSTGIYPDGARGIYIKKYLRSHIKKRTAHDFAVKESRLVKNFLKKKRRSFNRKEFEKGGVLNGFYGTNEIFPWSMWENLNLVQFEGSKVWVVKDVDTYLTQMFKNWHVPRQSGRTHGKFYLK